MAITTELQGEGSYGYDCGKKNCWYCDMITAQNKNIILDNISESMLIGTHLKVKSPKLLKYKPQKIKQQTKWPKFRAATSVRQSNN